MSVKFQDKTQARHFYNTKGNSTEARQITTNSNLQDIETNTDSCASSLNDMKEHTGLSATRLLNINNNLHQNGDGTGTSHGVMLDSCSSKLGDISSNSVLIASRLNNIQEEFVNIGSLNNLYSSASCVANGTASSVIDFGATRPPLRVQIEIQATASIGASGYSVLASQDNSRYSFVNIGSTGKTQSLSTTDTAGNSCNTQGGVCFDWGGFRYLKVIVYSLGTYSGTCMGSA